MLWIPKGAKHWAGDPGRTRAGQLRVGEGSDKLELGIELLDHAEAEIGGEQEAVRAACREGQAFVDRTREPPLTHG